MVGDKDFKIFLGGHNSQNPLIKNTEIGYKFFLANAGFSFCDDLTKADAVILIELDRRILSAVPAHLPVILIRNEPEVVWPDNYKKHLVKRVNKSIDVGQVDNQGNFTPWPQDWNQANLETINQEARLDRFVLINGNRLSFIRGELYSLRRTSVRKIEELDLFGKSWDITFSKKIYFFLAEFYIAVTNGFFPHVSNARSWFSRPRNYFGAPENKFDVLSKYKYSLVIENSMGYMSEKLFDALLARTVPIYVGPKVELFGIPKGLVIQVDPKLKSIKKAIATAKEIDYDKWKNDLENWLAMPEAKDRWIAGNVFPRIVNEIKDYLIFIRSQKV